MKAIIFPTTSGANLYLITKEINKQLLPIYVKQMVYDSIIVMMRSGKSQMKHKNNLS